MIAPGTLLQNRYLVEQQIGQGGMGAVYVATDQRFGSTVALKETFFTDPALRRAFEREARLLNRLRHPALPRVSDHFNEEEGQFLVMEFIPGEDLSEMLKRRGGAFPAREVSGWADQLLDALDYLHTQEPPVIHRDIKPQNLKLTARNQIVLLDFGLAKGAPAQTRVTATGSLFGYSFNYAPLEQMQGAGTDPRSDLYSLGATLHHLLTGVAPPDALTRATAVLDGEPDPLRPADEINGGVPAAVSALLGRMMRTGASQRPASAAEVREALRAAVREAEAAGGEATLLTPPAAAGLSEQETRLFDARATAAAPNAEAGAGGARDATGAPVSSDRTAVAGAEPAGTSRNIPASDSVVTDVRTVRSVEGKRRLPYRAPGLAASVVVLVLVSAGVYSLSRYGAAPAAGEPAAPPETINPAVTRPAAPEPVSEPAEPTPEKAEADAAPAPTPARRADTQAARSAGKPASRRPAAGEVRDEPAEPAEPPETDPTAGLTENDFAGSPYTKAQIQALMRGAQQDRRRARQIRRRILEAQRRRGYIPPRPPQP